MKSAPKRKGRTGGSFLDIAGQRQPFGRLRAWEFLGRTRGHTWWRCRCSCGRWKVVSLWAFRNHKTKSCGCLLRETAREKGRARRVPGERVEEMVEYKRRGFTYKALARLFRCSPSWACFLVNRWASEHDLSGGRYIR